MLYFTRFINMTLINEQAIFHNLIQVYTFNKWRFVVHVHLDMHNKWHFVVHVHPDMHNKWHFVVHVLCYM